MPGRAYAGKTLDGNRTFPALRLQQETSEQDETQCWEQPGIPVSTRISHHPSPASSHGSLPQSPISLRQGSQLDNGSEVVLLMVQWTKAGSSFFRECRGESTRWRVQASASTVCGIDRASHGRRLPTSSESRRPRSTSEMGMFRQRPGLDSQTAVPIGHH